jgi:hypothetical protein
MRALRAGGNIASNVSAKSVSVLPSGAELTARDVKLITLYRFRACKNINNSRVEEQYHRTDCGNNRGNWVAYKYSNLMIIMGYSINVEDTLPPIVTACL